MAKMSWRLASELRKVRGSTTQAAQAARLGFSLGTYQKLEDAGRHHQRATLERLDRALVKRKTPGWKLGDAVTYDSEDSFVALRVEIADQFAAIRSELSRMGERLERYADQRDLLERLDALITEFRRR